MKDHLKTVTIRLPAATFEKLQALAIGRGTTRTSIAADMVRAGVDRALPTQPTIGAPVGPTVRQELQSLKTENQAIKDQLLAVQAYIDNRLLQRLRRQAGRFNAWLNGREIAVKRAWLPKPYSDGAKQNTNQLDRTRLPIKQAGQSSQPQARIGSNSRTALPQIGHTRSTKP